MTDPRDWLRAHWWVLVLLLVTLAGTFGRWHDHDRPGVGAGILAGLGVLVLLGRRRRPELTWLGNALAVTCYFAAGYPDGPVYLSIFASAYALTSRWAPRRWWPYSVAVLPILLARAIGVELVEPRVDRVDLGLSASSVASLAGRLTWFVAVLIAAAAIGAAVRTRTDTRREQARRTATEERLRMAQDLHDGVGHGLAVIAMQAGVALHVLERDPAKARESLLAIRETSRESLGALRDELSRLAADSGPRAPRNTLADLPALVARVRAGGLAVDLHVRDEEVPDAVGNAGYFVVQEALTNVLRHSEATTSRVDVSRVAAALVVSVVDDGKGGEVHEGMGIRGMRARVQRLGGTVTLGPTEHGFEVRASIPLEAR